MQSQVERLDLIRQKLDEKKAISTREIMKLCHVSFDTARRDVIKSNLSTCDCIYLTSYV